MSGNPLVTHNDAAQFSTILDIFDETANKELTIKAFDIFINQLASSNPLHAVQVNGFFCGLLGKNIGLNTEQINALSQKYSPMIISKLNSQVK